jgi:hypothetical protein
MMSECTFEKPAPRKMENLRMKAIILSSHPATDQSPGDSTKSKSMASEQAP